MASFGQNISKSLKTFDVSVEMGINRTEKLKPDLKSAQNSETTPGCPTQSIDLEQYLERDELSCNIFNRFLSQKWAFFVEEKTQR